MDENGHGSKPKLDQINEDPLVATRRAMRIAGVLRLLVLAVPILALFIVMAYAIVTGGAVERSAAVVLLVWLVFVIRSLVRSAVGARRK